MIRRLTLRRFKRFTEETFEFPGHIVLAGPNNTGKTTVLQAITAWDLALTHWRGRDDLHKHNSAYTRAPLARQAFAAVPLRAFDLLWHERQYHKKEPIEIEVESTEGWKLTIEIIPDSTEQVYVRPKSDVDPAVAREATLRTIFIPPMSGLSPNEPIYRPDYQQVILGQGKPGEIIRNLLLQAHLSSPPTPWHQLREDIRQLFGYELLPPVEGPFILAEYQTHPDGPRYDIASAGSGFQQILMLLTFLYTNKASVLLLDEPDAHLHVILQDTIYGKLRSVAAARNSQLLISTHSEVIIDSVEPRELCMLLYHPRLLTEKVQRDKLLRALRLLSNTDIMLALNEPGILYVEGHTDLAILREWARILNHPVHTKLAQGVFWKPTVGESRLGGRGYKASEHFDTLRLVNDHLQGLELIDGDANPNIQSASFEAGRLWRLRWRRYEIESYLFHPDTLARYVTQLVGLDNADLYIQDMHAYLEENLPPTVIRQPLDDHPYLVSLKARTQLLPPALEAAGLPGILYTRYHEIAAVMLPEEIHPEVVEKLDAIQRVLIP